MVSIYAIDWRYAPTRGVLDAISNGLEQVVTEVVPVDIDDALEQWESLIGVAFVTAQTYITGTVSDANKISTATPPLKKTQLLQSHSKSVTGAAITELQLIDAAANLFKHRDEWPSWAPVPPRKATIEVLTAVGINEHDSHPCRKAANILWTPDTSNLKPLLTILEEWREKVISSVT